MAMSNDDPRPPDRISALPQNARPCPPAAQEKRGLFSIPPPLKRIFDQFPLVVYPSNAQPLRARSIRDENALFIFTTNEDARQGRPSFNPSCLRWQTYLKFTGLPFRTVPSTNHASPSGALPFLLPAISEADQTRSVDPIASNKLKKWMISGDGLKIPKEPENIQHDAYHSLLESCIRKAWLFQLYLSPANSAVVHRLYVEPCSSNPLVQRTIAYQLQKAAESEVAKASTSNTISESDIMRESEEALDALGTLIGENEWFFACQQPTLFDASVFAYTHLILDENMDWERNELGDQLARRRNLVQHRNRILEMYY